MWWLLAREKREKGRAFHAWANLWVSIEQEGSRDRAKLVP